MSDSTPKSNPTRRPTTPPCVWSTSAATPTGRDAEAVWQDLKREFERLLKVVTEIAGRTPAPATGGRN